MSFYKRMDPYKKGKAKHTIPVKHLGTFKDSLAVEIFGAMRFSFDADGNGHMRSSSSGCRLGSTVLESEPGLLISVGSEVTSILALSEPTPVGCPRCLTVVRVAK